jgi:hypothetical protein
MMESVIAFKRANTDWVITYFATSPREAQEVRVALSVKVRRSGLLHFV